MNKQLKELLLLLHKEAHNLMGQIKFGRNYGVDCLIIEQKLKRLDLPDDLALDLDKHELNEIIHMYQD